MTVSYKVGDLLTCNADYICQQCNCLTVKAHGLAQSIANVFPHADSYAKRRQLGNRNLAVPEDCATPGTVSVHGRVINMYAQWRPGSCKTPYFSVYPEYVAQPENNSTRQTWFKKCLDAIAETLKQEAKTIAFPFQIGCGLAGGNWNDYEQMILAFAKENPQFTVHIVTRPEDVSKKRKIR